jgi:hypothetical protein
MTAFVYCSTNPEQKAIGEKIVESFPHFDPIPIYDTISMSPEDGREYLRKEFKKIRAKKICILYCGSFLDLDFIQELIGSRETYFYINDHFAGAMAGLSLAPLQKIVIDHYSHAISGAITLPYFACNPIPTKTQHWVADPQIEARILIAGDGHTMIPYRSIMESLGGRSARLYVENGIDHKMHDNQMTNEDIISQISDYRDRFSFVEKSDWSSYDLVITTPIWGNINIHKAISKDIPCLSYPTGFAKSLRQRYNCLQTRNTNDATPNALDNLDVESISKGMRAYREAHSHERIEEKLTPYFGKKKARLRRTPKENDRINVFLALRNNEDTIGKTLSTLKTGERQMPDHEFRYYLYENDSEDDTPNQIRDFSSHSKGAYKCEKFGKRHWAGNSNPKRMLDLARYRNSMKGLCTDWENSTYSFVVDSEITFDADIMERQIALMQSRRDAVMVTPYGTPEFSEDYYDLYAYRGMGDTLRFGDKRFGKTPPPSDKVSEAKSAFCGFVCILTSVLEKCSWDCTGAVSEHISFCEMVRQYGKILIDPEVTVRWRK